MNCPHCHRPLRDGAQFCTNCGTRTSVGRESLNLSVPTAESPGARGPAAAAAAASPDPLTGRVLDGKYELSERIGAGGMGAVYRARRVHIGDEVAVKVLHSKFVSDEPTVERFRREARAAAQLHHPNIVTIHDYGEAGGPDALAYIVMELLGGESLRGLLKREGRLSPARAAALVRQVCAGVGAAHRRQIVHRDIKPDNIIVLAPDEDREGETVKVVDFGIAKLRDLASDYTLTEAGAVVGTPFYMSPEQCRGEPLDARADVYSLGALLYEMLAGAPPFTAPTLTGVIAKHLTEAPPPLPASLGVPFPLEAAVARALAKDPGARYPDATEFSRAIQSAVGAGVGHLAADAPAHDSAPRQVTLRLPDSPTAHETPEEKKARLAHIIAEAKARKESRPHMQPYAAAPHGVPPPAAPRQKSRAPLVVGLLVLLLAGVSALGVAIFLFAGGPQSPPANRNNSRAGARATPTPGNTNDAATHVTPLLRAERQILANGLLSGDTLAALSPGELNLLRNTLYARHGRRFESAELRRYFQGRPWYRPRPDYSDDRLTDNDRANAELLGALGGGAAEQPADPEKVRDEVEEALDGWAESTRDRDLDDHMRHYADRVDAYYRKGSVSAAQVRADRSRAFGRYTEMDVKLENVEVRPDPAGTRATATFDKTWDFEDGDRHSTGSVRQQLTLAKIGGSWLITGEKDLKVHYKNDEEF